MDLDYRDIQYILTGVLLSLILIIYKMGTWSYGEFKSRNMVFAKPSFFFGTVGSLFLRKTYLDLSADYYNQYKGHRAIGGFVFLKPCIYLFDPEVIKLITTKDYEYFTHHTSYVGEGDNQLYGGLIFAARGKRWRTMRSAIGPAFTSNKMKTGLLDVIKQHCDRLTSHMLHKCEGSPGGQASMDMKDLLMPWSTDVMAEISFGMKENSLEERDNNELYRIVKNSNDFTGSLGFKFVVGTGFPSLLKMFGTPLSPKYATDYYLKIVREWKEMCEKNKVQGPNYMQHFLEAKQKNMQKYTAEKADTYYDINDMDMAASAFNFLGAAFDSIGTVHSNLAYLFAMNPDKQERARQEVEEIIEEEGGLLTYEGLQRMTYLDQAVKECLRILPPVLYVDRSCTKDYIVPATESAPAIKFKKGDIVVISVMGLQRDPDLFENPDCFEPERFSSENKHKIVPGSFIPFGAGPRACLGGRYVYFEAKILFASLLPKFSFERIAKTPTTFRWEVNALSVNATHGYYVGFKPRTTKQ